MNSSFNSTIDQFDDGMFNTSWYDESALKLNSKVFKNADIQRFQNNLKAPVTPAPRTQPVLNDVPLTTGKRSLKEMNEMFDNLKRENFELKLKLFHLQERESKLTMNSKDSFKKALDENIELKVFVDQLEHELASRNDLLLKARAHIASLQSDLEAAKSLQDNERSFSAAPPGLFDERTMAVERENEALQSQLTQLKQDSSSSNARIKGLEEQAANDAYRIECLQSDLRRASEERDAKAALLSEALAALDAAADDGVKQSNDNDVALRNMRRERDDAVRRVDQLTSAHDKALQKIDRLTQECDQLERSMSSTSLEHDRVTRRAKLLEQSLLSVCNRLAASARDAPHTIAAVRIVGEQSHDDAVDLDDVTRDALRDVAAVQQRAQQTERAAQRAQASATEAERRAVAAAAAARERVRELTEQQQQQQQQRPVKVEPSVENRHANGADGGSSGIVRRLNSALERVERLEANNRVLILELEDTRGVTEAVSRKCRALQQQNARR